MDGKASYRAALRALDMKAFGSVHGGKKGAELDVTVKLSCHDGELGPYLEVKLTVTAPASMHCPENKYSTYSKLYTGSIDSYKHELISEDKLEDVPAEIRNTRFFDETVLAYKEGKPGVVKLTFNYFKEDSTHEGLFTTQEFRNYIDTETDQCLGNKPHIQSAINYLQQLFSRDGDLTFYVRNEESDFQDEFNRIMDAMDLEHEDGPIINKFYQDGATIAADGSPRTPYLQINHHVPLQKRPAISTNPTFVHRNFTDFATRKGYAAIQSMEYEKQEVQKFNDTNSRMKFVTIAGGGNQKVSWDFLH
jgi:hypothetical protein